MLRLPGSGGGVVAPAAFLTGLLLMAIWLPFGFRMGALIEDWSILALFDQHGPMYFVGAEGPLAPHRMRPFTVLPQAVAYALDPDSFGWWHVILILSLLVRGVAGAWLVRWVTGSTTAGLVFGLLVVIYPADTMQLAFRGMHIVGSLALFLAAVAVQLHAADRASSPVRVGLCVVAALLTIVAIGMYEAALALTPMPLLLVYARFGWTDGIAWMKARWPTLLGYGLGVATCVVYIAYVLSGGQTYQATLADTGGRDSWAVVVERIRIVATVVLPRSILGGWLDAADMLRDEFVHRAYVLLACAVLLACLAITRVGARTVTAGGRAASGWRLVACAVLLMLLGHLPFTSSISHLHITQRAYLFATPGAALLWVSLLLVAWRMSRVAALTLGVALLPLGVGMQLYQFEHYSRIHDLQRSILSRLVPVLSDAPQGRTLLIRDASATLNGTWSLLPVIANALSYLLAHPVKTVHVCLEPGGHWQGFDPTARPGSCVEGPTGWTLRPPGPLRPVDGPPGVAGVAGPAEIHIPKSDLVVVDIDRAGQVSRTTDPLSGVAAPPGTVEPHARRRWRHVLSERPWPLGFGLFPRGPASDFRWDAGRWWNMDMPQQGSGWREADWTLRPLSQTSTVWKNLRVSTVLFDLSPINAPYVLEGRFVNFANDRVAAELRVLLNGSEIAYQWTGDGRFIAQVPRLALKAGENELAFDAPGDPAYFGLSMALDWVTLHAPR